MKTKWKYILIWLLPVALLGICSYYFICDIWIFFNGVGKWERLEGFAYFLIGGFYAIGLIITTIIALIITIRMKKKSNRNINTNENEDM